MKKTIAIIGGGASALALAAMLDESLFDITIYERQATLGRKFLVAGDGGFNLTHGEDLETFLTRYTVPSSSNLSHQNIENSLRNFTNSDTRNWLKSRLTRSQTRPGSAWRSTAPPTSTCIRRRIQTGRFAAS